MKSPQSLCLTLFILILTSCSEINEQVTWEGLVSQDDNFGISDSYKSTLKWTQKGNKLEGEGYFEAPQDTSVHVLYSFEGLVDSDTIRIQETGIISGTEIEGEWLTKEIKLYYVNESKKELRGSWVAQRKRNAYGVMKYTKSE